MDDGLGARRNPARYLAPLALAAVLAAIYVVVQHYTASTTAAPSATSAQRTIDGKLRGSGLHAAGRGARPTPQFYVVRLGDTLSEISSRVNVPLPTLETLNPGLQANAIQVGQRVRLRR